MESRRDVRAEKSPLCNRLTLFGMEGDTFSPLSFLDQILSADFFQKFPIFFGGGTFNDYVDKRELVGGPKMPIFVHVQG